MNKRSDVRCDEDVCSAVIIDEAAVGRVSAHALQERTTTALADIFDALSDPTRLRILHALSQEELCVCDLAAVTGVSQSAVSHQLRILRDLDLVAFSREGKRAVYRLADDHVASLLSQGMEHAEERVGGKRPAEDEVGGKTRRGV